MVSFNARPLPGPIPYTANTPWRGCLHTTQGSSTTDFNNGAVAPQITAWLQRRQVWKHYDYTKYAGKALKHPAGTPATNTTRCVQIEVVGFCDDANLSSPLHISKWTDGDYAFLADLMRQVEADTGMKSQSNVTWKAYGNGGLNGSPTSYGTNNGVRLGWGAWAKYEGWLGHQHVPGNVHGDPGNIDISKLLAKAAPVPTEGEEVMAGFARFAAPHPKAGALYVTNYINRRGVVAEDYRNDMIEDGVDYNKVHNFTSDSGMNAYAGELVKNNDGTVTDYNPDTKKWERH